MNKQNLIKHPLNVPWMIAAVFSGLAGIGGSLGCGSGGATTSDITLTTTVSSADQKASTGICNDFGIGVTAGTATGNCATANAQGTAFACVASETTACTATGRVASCAYTAPGGTPVTYRYYSTKFTAATAQTNCTALKGTYTSG